MIIVAKDRFFLEDQRGPRMGYTHRRRLWGGSPGTRPPIIRMGEKPLFAPPNNQTRIEKKFLFKKINMK